MNKSEEADLYLHRSILKLRGKDIDFAIELVVKAKECLEIVKEYENKETDGADKID